MGRRKIEIKAIKDDRNRSVTFLKRKGGLFKKAHELSVLCSVDVAVIIFGHNKKLYEFSSGNINDIIGRFQYYGEAHEHKGPADFAERGGGDDDDDEDIDDAAVEEQLAPEHSLPPHLQNQAGYQHMRQAPSASPPIANGVIPFHQRQHTPQPQMGSRPSSRNNIRRQSSNLVPQQHQQVTHAPAMSNGFAYIQNAPLQYGHPPQGMPVNQHPGPQPGQHSHFQYTPQPPQHAQLQQTYMEGQRRQSMPPAFPPNERPQLQPQPQRHTPTPPQLEPEQRSHHLEPEQPKPMPAKSRSIFTPIDDSRSLLAQHWGFGTASSEPRNEGIKQEPGSRSQSVDVGSVQRHNPAIPAPPPARPHRVITQPQRGQSISSQADGSGAKRPVLKVQIPSEQSDEGGSATAGSSPRGSGGTTSGTPAKNSTEASHSSGVVLPPPSPSASALLSAGAQGPPNPFARPHPPISSGNQNNQAYTGNSNIETPISALPSRFVADGLLPSPSSFYPEWGFGRSAAGDGNMLPSPLNFQTPVASNGPSFLRDEDGERKRKSPEGDGQQESNGVKRVKV